MEFYEEVINNDIKNYKLRQESLDLYKELINVYRGDTEESINKHN